MGWLAGWLALVDKMTVQKGVGLLWDCCGTVSVTVVWLLWDRCGTVVERLCDGHTFTIFTDGTMKNA